VRFATAIVKPEGGAFSDRIESKRTPESAFAGKSIARFAAEIAAMEEAMECCRTAGSIDYDAAAFDVFYECPIETIPLKSVMPRFALENVKSEAASPIACRRQSRAQGPEH